MVGVDVVAAVVAPITGGAFLNALSVDVVTGRVSGSGQILLYMWQYGSFQERLFIE